MFFAVTSFTAMSFAAMSELQRESFAQNRDISSTLCFTKTRRDARHFIGFSLVSKTFMPHLKVSQRHFICSRQAPESERKENEHG